MVAGLGNPGRKYEKTRHNVGFDVLDELLRRFPGATVQQKFDGRFAKVDFEGGKLLLLWPETFMNDSGRSISAAAKFFKVGLERLLVICDDLSLPIGKIRVRRNGSSGGQKGLQNTIQQLGSQEFSRLRVGIGATPDRWETSDYVLGKFESADRQLIDLACTKAADAVQCWATQGVDAAMNRYNRES